MNYLNPVCKFVFIINFYIYYPKSCINYNRYIEKKIFDKKLKSRFTDCDE